MNYAFVWHIVNLSKLIGQMALFEQSNMVRLFSGPYILTIPILT